MLFDVGPEPFPYKSFLLLLSRLKLSEETETVISLFTLVTERTFIDNETNNFLRRDAWLSLYIVVSFTKEKWLKSKYIT